MKGLGVDDETGCMYDYGCMSIVGFEARVHSIYEAKF